MEQQERGLLLEKNGGGVVLTAEGEFCRISSPTGEIGEEVPFSRGVARRWWTLALAAAVLAMLVGLGAYQYGYARPVAYVALDINPSLELGIDRKERVIEVNSLNGDAGRLVTGLSLTGRSVTEAIAIVIARAEEMRYLSPECPGVVLITVAPVRQGVAVPETKRLAQAAVQQLEKKHVPAKVVAADVGASLRKEARRVGLSPGRYALKVGAGSNKQVMTVRELKKEGLAQLEARRQVTIEQLLRSGHQKKVIVVPVKRQDQAKTQGAKGTKARGRGVAESVYPPEQLRVLHRDTRALEPVPIAEGAYPPVQPRGETPPQVPGVPAQGTRMNQETALEKEIRAAAQKDSMDDRVKRPALNSRNTR